MGSLTESFYDAMAQFVDAVPAGTTVIKATIIEQTDEAKNEYSVKYLTNKLTAYANSETVYQADSEVYVLVPDNNLKETLVILAGVEQTATSTAAATTQKKYENVSGNLITDTDLLDIIKLSSYTKTTTLENPLFAPNSSQANLFKTYFNDYHLLKLNCYIKTALEAAQQTQGNYGIKITIPVVNEKIEAENEYSTSPKSTTTELSYTLDINNINGNPYGLVSDTKQELYINIPSYYRYEATSAPKLTIFCENFPLTTRSNKINIKSDTTGAFYDADDIDGDGTDVIDFTNITSLGSYSMKDTSLYYFKDESGIAYPMVQSTESEDDDDYDIFIRNIDISVMSELTEEELTGYHLRLEATQGIYFLTNSDDTKTITPTLLIDGKETSISKSYSMYWLKEDPAIKTDSAYYLGYAGLGWRCLNTIPLDSHYGFDTSIRELEVKSEDIYSSCKYKCILLYHDEVVSNDITIINYASTYGYSVGLKSNRDVYSEGVGQVELTGSLTWTGTPSTSNLTYCWLRWDENNNYIEDLTPNSPVSSSKSITQTAVFNVDEIVNSNYITFAVYDGDNLIGSQKIKVSTSTELTHTLSILNDNIIYKYDSDGDSPCIDAYDGPISSKVTAIADLSFDFFFEDGSELSDSEYESCKVEWRIPIASMFDVKYGGTANNNFVQTKDDTYYYYRATGRDNSKLTYEIINKFDKSKASNSEILLTVVFNETTVERYVNIQFIKDGESGTNGTKYSAILGWTNSCIAYNKNGQKLRLWYNNGSWRYYNAEGSLTTIPSAGIPFSVQVYKDGSIMTSGYSVSYSFFDNSNKTERGPLTINNGTLYVNGTLNKYNNIIQAAVTITTTDATSATYNTKTTLYCYYPLDIIVSSNSSIKPNMIHGFDSVLYASDGTNPQYDTTYPFEMENVTGGSFSCIGNLTEKSSGIYTPYYKYDNGNTNNEILYTGSNFVYHKPIVYTYNRYEQSNLNGWDGNKLEMGDSYLIAPQIGTGYKNTDNTFTGLVMGIKSLNNSQSTISSGNKQVGLFGYYQGERSLFLNADNGAAIFGRASNGGQIAIDPSSSKARIYSKNYYKNWNQTTGLPSSYDNNDNGAGMLIDLSTPTIKFGSGKFEVDQNGAIKSTAGKIGGWTISDTTLSGNSLTLNSNGSIYSDNHTALNSSGTGFFINKEGLSIGSKFRVNNDGTMWIGNGAYNNSSNHWTINGDSSRSYIAYGGDTAYSEASSDSDTTAKVYLGTDGISIGKRFSVNSQGYLTAYSGKIGGWTITSQKLEANGIQINATGSIAASNGGWTISSSGNATFNNIKANGGTIGDWYIGGASGITKERKVGAGTSSSLYSKNNGIILDGTNNKIYCGGTEISSGQISFNSGATIINSSGTITSSLGESSAHNLNYLKANNLNVNVGGVAQFMAGSHVYFNGSVQSNGNATKTGTMHFSDGSWMQYDNGMLVDYNIVTS